MLKRDDFFALPDFVAKCNDNNTQINVQKVVKSLRENSIRHPRDLLRLSKEDLLETVGVDKKDLARAFEREVGSLDRGGGERMQREERKKMREERRMRKEKERREEEEKVAAAAMREKVIREKKRTRQAEQQRRKEEAVLKVPILEEKKDDLTIEKIKEEEEVVSSTSLPLQSPVKKRTLKRMKRRMRTGLICDGVRVTQRNSQLENYRLSFSDLPDSLQKELTKMKTFLTRRRLGPQEAPIANVTANKYEEHIRGICGWLIKEKEYKVKDLKSLSCFFQA